ncbi:YfhO family protein [Enterococcus sp. BWT-B8]|uniref:YfhO family protein n=1 Tax=Enterococcus sp. BWT-B8 TaxID=2885157 RepID=UPI003B63BB92
MKESEKTMIQTIKKKWLNQNSAAALLSFLLPVLILAIVYWRHGIYPGSELTILSSDSFVQYSNFHASLHNVLTGKQNIFYTWSGSLGLNYWSLMAYYLNGLFSPLVVFFDNYAMPDTLYYLTLLKFGCSGLSFWVFGRATYRKLSPWMVTGLSVSYALIGYAVGYSQVIMWLDTFVYLPLIILGIHRLMDQQKPGLLFISYLVLFVSNFYMAFMVGVFSFLYFLIRTLIHWEKAKRQIGLYLATSLLAGGASMVTILPTLLDLSSNGESLTSIQTLVTADTGPWDMVAKLMVGVYDTSKYESMAFVYAGLLPLIFCLFYFVSRQTTWKERLGYGSLFVLLIGSIYIYPLNLFWHGLHAPNMFLFRFSFLIAFLILLLAGYGLERYTSRQMNTLMNIFLGVGSVFLTFLLLSNKKRYGIITTETIYITFGLLIIYLGIYLLWEKKPTWHRGLLALLVLLMCGEAFVNTRAMITGIRQDWGYPSRVLYTTGHQEIQTLTDLANDSQETFFRMENLDRLTLNDSFNFGYSGVGMFSSIRNRHSSQYVNALGFRSLGTNLNIQYANNTLLGDALVGIQYNIAKGDPMKFGFEKVATNGDYSLYENRYALPLGILTDEGIYQEGVLNNQTELFQYFSGKQLDFYSVKDATIVDSEYAILTEKENGTILNIGEEQPGKNKSVTWSVTVPAHSQGYLSLVPTDFGLSSGMDVQLTVNEITRSMSLPNSGQYYNIGYYEETTTVEVTTTFPRGTLEQTHVSLYKPDVLVLDTEKYAAAIELIQNKGVEMVTEGRVAIGKVNAADDQVLFTTIPYDRGWRVYIDGKEVAITPFKEAFLTVPVTAGEHEIRFVYLPPGFAIGVGLLLGCTGLFIGMMWMLRRKQRKEVEDDTN